MNLYAYSFYRFMTLFRGSEKVDLETVSSAIAMISGLPFLNTLAVISFFDLHKVIDYKIVAIIFISLFITNSIYILSKNRYQKICNYYQESESKRSKAIGVITIWLYISLSFIILIISVL